MIYTPTMSEISVLPNLPMLLFNLSPVNVLEIFQNFICPEPLVAKYPDNDGDIVTL